MRFIIFLTILCISTAFTADKSAVTQKAEASHPIAIPDNPLEKRTNNLRSQKLAPAATIPIPIPTDLSEMKPAVAPPVPPIPPELREMKPSELDSRKQMAEAAMPSPALLEQSGALNLRSKSPMPSREKKHKLSSKAQKAEEHSEKSLSTQNEREQYVNEKK